MNDVQYMIAYFNSKHDNQVKFQGVLAETKHEAQFRFSKVFSDATILKIYREV